MDGPKRGQKPRDRRAGPGFARVGGKPSRSAPNGCVNRRRKRPGHVPTLSVDRRRERPGHSPNGRVDTAEVIKKGWTAYDGGKTAAGAERSLFPQHPGQICADLSAGGGGHPDCDEHLPHPDGGKYGVHLQAEQPEAAGAGHRLHAGGVRDADPGGRGADHGPAGGGPGHPGAGHRRDGPHPLRQLHPGQPPGGLCPHGGGGRRAAGEGRVPLRIPGGGHPLPGGGAHPLPRHDAGGGVPLRIRQRAGRGAALHPGQPALHLHRHLPGGAGAGGAAVQNPHPQHRAAALRHPPRAGGRVQPPGGIPGQGRDGPAGR